MRRGHLLLWGALALAGCQCGSPMGASCESDDQCAADESCVDGQCEARATFDAGRRTDAGTPRDAGRVTAPDAGRDAACGGENVPFDYRPPNVLIIFDRSCSMRRRLDDTDLFGTGPDDPSTRWAVARDGVLGLIGRYPSRVFWGLMVFPDPRETCGDPVDTEVPPGPGTASGIDAVLRSADIQPFGLCGLDNTDMTTQPRQTPTADALTSAAALPALMDTTRPSFAIIVTDGGVSCGVTNDELTALAASLLAQGIPTGVIGFTTGAEEASLEAIASAGGLARAGGPPDYYVADDAASLDSVLDEIARRVVSCVIPLSSAPPDPSALVVTTNDGTLASDPTDGWSYDADANTLTLNGAACDRLRSGETTRLSITFGCAPVDCTPVTEICNGFDDDCDDSVDEDCLR